MPLLLSICFFLIPGRSIPYLIWYMWFVTSRRGEDQTCQPRVLYARGGHTQQWNSVRTLVILCKNAICIYWDMILKLTCHFYDKKMYIWRPLLQEDKFYLVNLAHQFYEKTCFICVSELSLPIVTSFYTADLSHLCNFFQICPFVL